VKARLETVRRALAGNIADYETLITPPAEYALIQPGVELPLGRM
jgi:hypothetical protein